MSGSPGVIVVQDFVVPGQINYIGYLNYMNRPGATGKKVEIRAMDGYLEYMENLEKSTGLFSEKIDVVKEDDLNCVKNIYETALQNESILWRPVISFDNSWLEENHLYSKDNHWLDEEKIKSYTRTAMNKLLKDEKMENAVWTAAIHYNTDNIHIHVAIVEPVPMRQKQLMQDGSYQYRGKFKLKSIERFKSSIINNIIDQQPENEMINTIIRKNIIEAKKDYVLLEDQKFAKDFLKLYEKMPKDRRSWKYNAQAMKKLKKDIDKLSDRYIDLNHHDDYINLKQLLLLQEMKYTKAYGGKSNNYMNNKLEDLHVRLGNVILKEMLEFDRSKKTVHIDRDEDDFEKEHEDLNNIENNDESKDWDECIFDKRYKEMIGGVIIPNEKERLLFKKGNKLLKKGLKENNKNDIEEGLKCLTETLKHGNTFAYYPLGKYYLDKGVRSNTKDDIEKGLDYLKKSENEGYKYADYVMGKYYLKYGTELNNNDYIEKGITFLEKAVDKGVTIGQYKCGKYYLDKGIRLGIESDIQKGIFYLEKVARDDSSCTPYAQYQCGKYYLDKGIRFNKKNDIKKGIDYLEKLAESNCPFAQFAQYKLGRYYIEHGKDIQRGKAYMERARENGNIYADHYLKQMQKNNKKNIRIFSSAMKVLQAGLKDEYEHFKLQQEYESMLNKKIQEKDYDVDIS